MLKSLSKTLSEMVKEGAEHLEQELRSQCESLLQAPFKEFQHKKESRPPPKKESRLPVVPPRTGEACHLNWLQPELCVLPNGDSVPDFSSVGCDRSWMEQSHAPSIFRIHLKLASEPLKTDRSEDIRQALQVLSARPLDSLGFRGILELEAGVYRLDTVEGFQLTTSGIIIRGSRPPTSRTPTETEWAYHEPATRLVCFGRQPNMGPLFQVQGQPCRQRDRPEDRIAIRADRVPVGSCELPVAKINGFQIGDWVQVVREGNQRWIETIGMHAISKRPNAAPEATSNWKPFTLRSLRRITHVDPERLVIHIDAPLTTAIEEVFGGGYVYKLHSQLDHEVQRVALEHLLVENEPSLLGHYIDKAKHRICEDELHFEKLVTFQRANQCWLFHVHAKHFGFHTDILNEAHHISILGCAYLKPAGRCVGGKRYGFTFAGQLSLVAYCYAEEARHAFAADARTCGPNVFHACRSTVNFGCSETHHRWGNGVLYDQVEADIAIQDRQWMGSGQGWSGANCLLWNCKGKIIVQSPPTAWNYAIGTAEAMCQDKASFPKGNESDSFLTLPSDQFVPSLYKYQMGIRSRARCL